MVFGKKAIARIIWKKGEDVEPLFFSFPPFFLLIVFFFFRCRRWLSATPQPFFYTLYFEVFFFDARSLPQTSAKVKKKREEKETLKGGKEGRIETRRSQPTITIFSLSRICFLCLPWLVKIPFFFWISLFMESKKYLQSSSFFFLLLDAHFTTSFFFYHRFLQAFFFRVNLYSVSVLLSTSMCILLVV